MHNFVLEDRRCDEGRVKSEGSYFEGWEVACVTGETMLELRKISIDRMTEFRNFRIPSLLVADVHSVRNDRIFFPISIAERTSK